MPTLPMVRWADVSTMRAVGHGVFHARGRRDDGDRAHVRRQTERDVLVVRPEGSLLYFSVNHVRDALSAGAELLVHA